MDVLKAIAMRVLDLIEGLPPDHRAQLIQLLLVLLFASTVGGGLLYAVIQPAA